MGGRVDVKSELGKGSTFSVFFKVMYQISDQLSSSDGISSPNNSSNKSKQQRQGSKEEYKCSTFMPKTLKPAESQKKKYRVLIANDEIFLLQFLEQMF